MVNIRARSEAIIAKALFVDRQRVVDDASLFNDLGADSLERIALVMELEEEFGVEINDDAIETFDTVGDVIRFLEARR